MFKKNIHKNCYRILVFSFFLFSFIQINFLVNNDFVNYCYAVNPEPKTENLNEGANVEISGNPFFQVVAGILIGIIRLFAIFITTGVALIQLTLKPEFQTIIANDAILAGWKTVRDILNIFFIFFLLYSAFCTVFQISKYHIKSTWVMIVVMALLVNFSWPVTRVMIDVSNVAMQYIIGDKGIDTSNSLFAKFGKESSVLHLVISTSGTDSSDENIVQIKNKEGVFTSLLMGIVASALFAFTIFAVAFMLVVRVIALAIYLVFASVGYTLAAFPGTSSYSSKWWDGFMKQLIVGPILLFSLLLAANVLDALKKSSFTSAMSEAAKANGGMASLLQYLVAILLIWSSIIASQEVGAQGSSMALGFAHKMRGKVQGVAKGIGKTADYGMARMTNRMAGSQNKGAAFIGKGMGLVRSVPDRVGNMKKESKENYAKALETSKAHGLAIGGDKLGGDKNAVNANIGKQIEEKKKKLKETPLNTATNIEAEAKAQLLIDKKDGIKEDDIKNLIKSLDSLDEDTKKAALKKAGNEGYGHLTAAYEANKEHEAEVKSENQRRNFHSMSALTPAEIQTMRENKMNEKMKSTYENMDGKTMAKQKIFTTYKKSNISSPDHDATERAYVVADEHIKRTLRGRNLLDFNSAAGAANRNNDIREAANNYSLLHGGTP